ncbi:hypothetical protein YPD27_0628 [Yersinia pestis KIM D27]|uniref:Uncharacterized protein n=1 Tax=Yersinia pestis PY-08 TaxID=992134 RepID=A0AB72ZL89_YERPE|nr:hypothetical protein YpF1991016_0464 [Yersinia pestis biovar Orientalis str. F1991016]EDR43515.1 hypothetical protein YpE1979001_2467 [Yersinia pestis biovar Antiqua str. E1979001]EDR58503.1 hypothetical protein YpMG051020_0715 [Yersinia pestis biovar Orientalis str. MG05-1020]EDR61670.1 hypothetical protein YpUG050454_2058 [Yersinia pestis biovar Antiqua str. UG05-0454]EDR66807.1 hypothetical protein YpK1973002_1316 [Yersinia pestis biovar Mediaevalis str. K1973002]EFA46432.1 hypothetical 
MSYGGSHRNHLVASIVLPLVPRHSFFILMSQSVQVSPVIVPPALF